MKINGFSPEFLKLLAGELKETAVKKSSSAKKGCTFDGISVEITEELSFLEPEEVSKERVEEIKRAIKEGRYEVNPHRISEAIVKEFLGE